MTLFAHWLICRISLLWSLHSPIRRFFNSWCLTSWSAFFSLPFCYRPDCLQNPQSILADLASMLLSNLSVSSTTCSTLLSMLVPVIIDPSTPDSYYPTQSRSDTCPPAPAGDPREFSAVALLVDAFNQGALVDEAQDIEKRKRKGQLHFLASVFANLSTVRVPTAPIGNY